MAKRDSGYASPDISTKSESSSLAFTLLIDIAGFVKNNDGNWISTRRAAIHYSKDGTHVVPA